MSDPSTKNEWMFEAMALRRRVAELEAARDDALEQASDFSMQDEARAARIAELEAEVARLRAASEIVDADMEDANAPTWTAEIRLPPSNALAAAYERGAREFAEDVKKNDPELRNYVDIDEHLARFLASRGTGIAESKAEEG